MSNSLLRNFLMLCMLVLVITAGLYVIVFYFPNSTDIASEINEPTLSPTQSPIPTLQPDSVDDSAVSNSIEFQFVGDVMMDDVIGDYIELYGVDYPWTDVAPILRSADIAVANLETSVSTRGVTYKPQGYGFRSHPRTVQGLVNAGFDFVSIANNHSLDFGQLAIEDTMNTLDSYQIQYTGAGMNRQQAEKLALVERNGLKVGFLGYTSILPNESWIAQEQSAGVAPLKPEYYDRIISQIELAAETCDMLVINLHWGVEHSNQVETWQRELARRMIDAGADVIVGHHPHVLRGIELYKNKPILYSTGNFVFLKRDENAGKTAIFKVKMNLEGFVEGSIQPVFIQYGKANLLDTTNVKYQEIIGTIGKLSTNLGTIFTSQGAFSSQSP